MRKGSSAVLGFAQVERLLQEWLTPYLKLGACAIYSGQRKDKARSLSIKHKIIQLETIVCIKICQNF